MLLKVFFLNVRVLFFLFFFSLLCSINVFSDVVDKVLVVVNDEVVTQREFDKVYSPVKTNYESRFKGEELQKQLDNAKSMILEQLINSKLVISLAKKEKMEIKEEELKERIDKIKSYYESEDIFLQALNAKGTNLTEFQNEIKEQMLAQKLVEKEVASKIDVTPIEIKDLFEKNKEKMIAPKRVKTKGILVRKKEQEDKTKEDESLKKIQEVASELKKGRDFSELAKEYSEGPYAEKGGEMGYIARGDTLPEIDEVLFSLKESEVSDVIETSLGYHLLLVEEIQEQRDLSFEEVSDYLKQQIYMKKFEENLLNWLEEKRKNAYITYK